MPKKKRSNGRKIVIIVVIVIALFLMSLFFAGFISIFFGAGDTSAAGNVALIKINGVILTEKDAFLFGRSTISSEKIVEFIKDADEDNSIKAIVFEINSPGGSAVASEEIVRAVKNVNKPTVSVIRESGVSGSYWVASATDKIYANPLSAIGSVGVLASYVDIAGLMDKYNITYNRLISGKYKDMGTPLKELTSEEKDLFQDRLDFIHEYFIDSVAENRNLNQEQIDEISTAIFYIGEQAIPVGLIDEIGNMDDAIAYLEQELNITVELAEYKESIGFFEALAQASSNFPFKMGQGIGTSLSSSESDSLSILT